MRTPTVHLNGTSSDVLAEQLSNAARALDRALGALCEAHPSARDYYMQGDTESGAAIREAMREHEDRIKRVRSVRDEILAMCEGVSEQIEEREANRAR